ncbi:hypothetical protein [Promicromonospora sp. NFX87]|uniref:hypothetical protein n=1 Tax=Promicromonospora sp. NFX87 TaxID=3402691 RepID=UPI003AFA0FEE
MSPSSTPAEQPAERKPMKISIPAKSDAPRTKTTARMDIASLLGDRDQRVLLVDVDPTPDHDASEHDSSIVDLPAPAEPLDHTDQP